MTSKRKLCKYILLFNMIFLCFVNSFSIYAKNVLPPNPDAPTTIYADELVTNALYSTYNHIPRLIFNESSSITYGKKVQDGYAGSIKKVKVEQFGFDEYGMYDKLAYSVYELGVMNMPYVSTPYGLCEATDSITITYEQVESSTYEETLKNTITMSNAFKNGVEASLDIFKIGLSSETEIQNSISNTFTTSHTFSTKKSISQTHNISSTGIYFAQRRANYRMYAICSYEIEYIDVITKKIVGVYENKYHEYKIKGYKYLNTYVWYEFITDFGNAFVKYDCLDNGSIKYAGPKVNDSYFYI